MSKNHAAVLEDRDRLEGWLADHGFLPYVDFEIVTVTLEDGALELDAMGKLERLTPALETFAGLHGFLVEPFDPEKGTISLLRNC